MAGSGVVTYGVVRYGRCGKASHGLFWHGMAQ